MLDALSDFWKPQKKSQGEKLGADQLQVGSAIVFGFVPQASLSGRRMQISAINTYQFGSEALTSFVLTQEQGPGISMIVAESEGEQYLAISRRITMSDRIKMFESKDIEDITEKADAMRLACRENPDFKGWTVATYRREIQGMKGMLYAGDFRKIPLPAASVAQEFKYTLLASDNNEHAVEIEKYPDGRIEMYATVYRRVSDIGEVSHPMRPDLKLADKPEEKPAPMKATVALTPVKPAPVKPAEKKEAAKAPEEKPIEVKQPFTDPIKVEPIALSDFPQPVAAPFTEPKPQPIATEEKKPMSMPEPAAASPQPMRPAVANGGSPKFSSVSAAPAAAPSYTQENKPMLKAVSGMDNDSIECDLRVASKVIDEAVRSEMRLSDVVRRIVELPVTNQGAVQIPVTLSDDDYSLLAVRYGIAANDRAAIKRRIAEELNDFSGGKK